MEKIFLHVLLTFICTLSVSRADITNFYIKSDGIRVRDGASERARIVGFLDTNDMVRTVSDSTPEEKFIQIQIVQTKNEILPAEKYFISKDFLSLKMIDFKDFRGQFFIVINVASETLRLYERQCREDSCTNKMVMETEVVVGEDTRNSPSGPGKGKSILGSFRLTGWTKFYEDSEGHYPSWYNENYPPTPKARARDPRVWFSPLYMPRNSAGKPRGVVRGAFGWYTAFLGPNHFNQWLHGTIGWGEDKDFYIKDTKKLFPNIFLDPRSSGCTRNNNEAIAYLRHLAPTGTPVIKIYAIEKLADPTFREYPDQSKNWNYVLTKTKIKEADREAVLKYLGLTSEELDLFWKITRTTDIILDPNNPLMQVLEVGTYQVDVHPDAIKYTPGERMGRFGRKLGRNGNVYGVRSKEMHGLYYVDTGQLENYQHPPKIEVGGFPDEITPGWMLRTP